MVSGESLKRGYFNSTPAYLNGAGFDSSTDKKSDSKNKKAIACSCRRWLKLAKNLLLLKLFSYFAWLNTSLLKSLCLAKTEASAAAVVSPLI